MNRVIALERDDDIVRELLAPFERVQPVSLRRGPRPRRSRPLLLAAATAGVAVLAFTSLATAGAIGSARCTALLSAPTRRRSLPERRTRSPAI